MAIFKKVVDFLNTPLPGTKKKEDKKEEKKGSGIKLPSLKKSDETQGPQKMKAVDIQAAMRKREREVKAATKKASDEKLRNELLAERRKLRELRREYESEMAKEAAAHAEAEETTYTVAAGDSLWKIADRFYGNGAEWGRIHEANKDKIPNANLIYPGQTIVIPEDDD